MNSNHMLRIFSGAFVLISLARGAPGGPWSMSSKWLWFSALVGANLLQSGPTRFCPLETPLRSLGGRVA